ncbi:MULTISPECIES: adenylate kinase [unclassified Leptolyngbya]|uniref:AAA family ATPase n=1 Tax=unclassified Leptolyngbya TaxID=2650499 RepID=UPI001687DE25|nr:MULTISPECIES: adenylate kinase [unclassified Leptolyngbya]MBD1913494.1 adenylate kinase [Leptolyngbya sp. FACHB-8]MBD2154880.1 adenylate kinase [Leptolyngbya sp. FACHB-16]
MAPPWRISIVGTSGSGKSTLASALASRLQLPHIELDQLHWLPNWTPRELEDFRARVDTAIAGEQWVIDGNYSKVRDRIWPRANLIVWLDYPRWVVMGRLLKRTARRVLTRQELWNGNRENLHTALLDRDAVLFWAWRTHSKHRRTYPEQLARPEYAHLSIVRLRSPRETERWLKSFGTDS